MKNLFSLIICLFTTSCITNIYGQSNKKVQAPIAQSVIIGENGSSNPIGYFEEMTNDVWESNINGQTTLYSEVSRDEWTISLVAFDKDQIVALNLWTQKVFFDGVEKYNVLESRSDAVPDEYITSEKSGVITNVAKGKPAKQSSNYSAGPGKDFQAGKAVDGIKEGFGLLSHTLQESGAWWEVDLGRSYNISSITVYNATDHPQRMDNFTILVSETPFTGNSGGVAFIANQKAPNPTQSFTGNAAGRYVRLFLNGTNYLTIHEIEIFGSYGVGASTPPTITSTPVVTTPPITTSSPVVTTTPVTTGNPPKSDRQSINEYINKLNYDTRELLSTKEDGASEAFSPRERTGLGNSVIICTKEKKTAGVGKAMKDISFPSRTIFPGALIYGDNHLAEGKPRFVSIARSPMTVTLLLNGSGGRGQESGSRVVDNPSISTLNTATETLLNNWHKANSSSDIKFVNGANQFLSVSRLYDSNQAALDLGFNAKWAQGNVNVDASMTYKDEKETTVAFFKQIYYTVACDKPTTPADFFAPTTTLAEVQEVINAKEPPAYIKSVDYGRMLMIRMETSKTEASADLKATLNYAAGTNEVGGSIDASYKKTLESSTFYIYALGGNAQAPTVITGDVEGLKKLKDVIYNGAIFNEQNPGMPLSYTVNYLQKDELATVSSTSTYIETKCETFNNGYIILKHGGGYVGRFIVTWEIDGKHCGQDCTFESGKQANGWKQTVTIPADAKNVKILGQFGGIGTNNWQEVISTVENGPTACTYLIRGSAVVRFGQKIDPDGNVVKEYK